jgi:hypothetical protein
MQSANGKAIEMELPKCIGDHVLLSSAPGAGCDATGFSVCPAGFWSCFDLIFPCYSCVPFFWNGNLHTCHYVLEICNSLLIYKAKSCLES